MDRPEGLSLDWRYVGHSYTKYGVSILELFRLNAAHDSVVLGHDGLLLVLEVLGHGLVVLVDGDLRLDDLRERPVQIVDDVFVFDDRLVGGVRLILVVIILRRSTSTFRMQSTMFTKLTVSLSSSSLLSATYSSLFSSSWWYHTRSITL